MADNRTDSEVALTRDFLEALLRLKDEATLTDVVVVVGEAEFPCHRVILAAASDFFKAAITTDMKEAREGQITLHDVTADVFSTLLSSIYEHKNVLTDHNLFDVWAAADMLQMRSIIAQCVAKCKKIFNTELSTENCIDYLIKVRLLNQQIKQQALEFIGNHFTDFDIQLKLTLLKVDELKSLMTMKGLNVSSEDDVIERMITWIEGNQHSKPPEEKSSDSKTVTPLSAPGSVSVHDFADILECTRYLLIREACLHGTLAIHPLIKSDPRCRSIVEKISYYQAHPHLHQSWCPPAAVHRENSGMTNVLLVCQLTHTGRLEALDLRDMTWKQITLRSVNFPSNFSKVLYYKSEIYIHCNKRLDKHFPKFEKGRSLPFSEGIIRVVYDSLYMYSTEARKDTDGKVETVVQPVKLCNFPASFNDSKLQFKRLQGLSYEFIDGLNIANVIHIGLTRIIFLATDKGIQESYTVLTYNEICTTYNSYPDQLGSSSRLVTFNHYREAFALQENGCLWRIQLEEDLMELKITQELELWDGEIPLNGAVLYNDQLVIVGYFPDQSEDSTTLDRSLAGVFQSIRKVKRSYDNLMGIPEISLAVLPKTLLK